MIVVKIFVVIIIIVVVVMLAEGGEEYDCGDEAAYPISDEKIPVHLPNNFCHSDFLGGRKPIRESCLIAARRFAIQNRIIKPMMVRMGVMVVA